MARRWSDGESSPWTHLLCGRSGDDGCVGRIRGAGRRTQELREAISPHVREVTGVDPRDVSRLAEDYAHAFVGT